MARRTVPSIRASGSEVPSWEEQKATESRLTRVEERTDTNRMIGWWLAGFLGTALVAVATWWVPQRIDAARDQITSVMNQEAASANEANQKRFTQLEVQLAKVEGLLQLKETGDVIAAVKKGVDFSKPSAAFVTVTAILDQAKQVRLKTSLADLKALHQQIQSVANTNPDYVSQAWNSQLSLIGYRIWENGAESSAKSFQLTNEERARINQEAAQRRLHLVSGFTLDGGNQVLDGGMWVDIRFRNAKIIYRGGPMILRDVTFVDCTFIMPDISNTVELANLVIDKDQLTGSFGS